MPDGRCNEADAREGAQLEGWVRLVLGSVPALLWSTDRELRVTAALGKNLLDPSHARSRELVGKPIEDLLGGEPSALHAAMHRRALAGEAVTYGCQAGDRFCRVSLDSARDEACRICGVVGVAIDETSQEAERARIVEAERRLRAAQAVAHVGSWVRDLDDDHAEWSEETCRIFGIGPKDFDGSLAAQLARLHPDDREKLEQAYALATSRPGPLELDYRILRPDGAERMLHTQMEPLGPGRRIVGASQDVTEQRAAERQLTTALSLLEATLESTADGVVVVDNETRRIVRYNAKFTAIWRIPRDVLETGKGADALAWVCDQVADPDRFAADIEAMYEHPEHESYDEILLKDGRILERYSQPQRVDGKAVARVWSFRDVTDRRRAEAARDELLEAERGARRAAQNAAARASLVAEASRILTSLDQDSALRTLAARMAASFADCCAIDLVEMDGTVRRVATAPEDASSARLPCASPESATAVAESEGHALLGVPLAVSGKLLGMMRYARPRSRGFGAEDLALAEDVAGRASLAIEIASAYRRSEEALRARDEFLSLASHELRTPLATLQATMDTVLAGAHGEIAPNGPLARPLRSMARQVRRLSRVGTQVLDAMAVSTVGIDLQWADVDLAALAGAAVERVRAECARVPADLSFSAPAPVLGRWDEARIAQVIEALLWNALRFSAGKPVEVKVVGRNDRAVVTVRDSGNGIAPDRVPGIFHRFDRAGAPSSMGGLGLGLYIGRAIVERHGGSVRVETGPGEGTTFTIELPTRPEVCP